MLCASSDRYLESVLRRADEVPASRALPDDLPEWKQVDFDAPVWMLRHIPKAAGKTHAVGVTAAITRDGFRVTYIPRIGSDFNIEEISKQWLPDGLFQTPASRDKLKIVRQPEGTVVLSSGARPDDETVWFAWQLYWFAGVRAFSIAVNERRRSPGMNSFVCNASFIVGADSRWGSAGKWNRCRWDEA